MAGDFLDLATLASGLRADNPKRANVLKAIREDEDAIRRSTHMLLKVMGYEPQTHESGIAFLDALPDLPEGCVLLDIRMPEMDGLEVQRRMKAAGFDAPVYLSLSYQKAEDAPRRASEPSIMARRAKEARASAVNSGISRAERVRGSALTKCTARGRLCGESSAATCGCKTPRKVCASPS